MLLSMLLCYLLGSLSDIVGQNVIRAECLDMGGAGGLNAKMRRLKITFEDGSLNTLVLKYLSGEQSKQLGLPREALFYQKFGKFVDDIPEVIYSEGDMGTGDKIILFEDLTGCIQSGYWFGSGW